MSNNDFDKYSDGEWEDRGETAWNEFDWQQYLLLNARDIDKFRSLYDRVKDDSNSLNEAAILMGWDHEDWSQLDLTFEDFNSSGAGEISGKSHEEEETDYDHLDPYTLHRHPVFIVTRGLYLDLKKSWEMVMQRCPRVLTPAIVWQYSISIHAGEMNAILSIQAIDIGDYALAVCHLKTALSDLNQSISILLKVPHKNSGVISQFKKLSIKRLFDMREVWLRMMGDCREELQRRFKGGE